MTDRNETALRLLCAIVSREGKTDVAAISDAFAYTDTFLETLARSAPQEAAPEATAFHDGPFYRCMSVHKGWQCNAKVQGPNEDSHHGLHFNYHIGTWATAEAQEAASAPSEAAASHKFDGPKGAWVPTEHSKGHQPCQHEGCGHSFTAEIHHGWWCAAPPPAQEPVLWRGRHDDWTDRWTYSAKPFNCRACAKNQEPLYAHPAPSSAAQQREADVAWLREHELRLVGNAGVPGSESQRQRYRDQACIVAALANALAAAPLASAKEQR